LATLAVAQPRSVSSGMFLKSQCPSSRPQLDVRPLIGPCESGPTLQWLLLLIRAFDFILSTYVCNKNCDVELCYLVVTKLVKILEQFVVLAPVDSYLLPCI